MVNIKRNTKTNRKYKRKNRKTKRKRGGKIRTEKIYYTVGRNKTNPDIRSEIRIKSGPTTYDSSSASGYMINFVSNVAKNFEEDIAVILTGEPKTTTKNKVLTFEYNDNDAPLTEGSTNPIKCKKKKK
jgi:hypothetical protein